ncbi:hypothetical protein ACFWZ2_37235 [Streptomyces sp. NPDC059002]|uniref:hypothetical protein n=1 Tax=Streptomyces sp. NPDC059002 TaxID=3346690 RepID=UPI003692A9FD
MSDTVTDLVWNSSRSKRGAFTVMLALARESDELGKTALSLEEIAELTRLSPRSVTTCLRDLSGLGELIYVPGGGRGHQNQYSIRLGNLAESTSCDSSTPADAGTGYSEVSSQSRKPEAKSGKLLPQNAEVSSSDVRGVITPVGSNNTSQEQASPDPSRVASKQQSLEPVDVPADAQEVVAAMTHAGMLVGWRLSADEWDRVTALSARWGTERLVEVIARRWDPARPPQSARYLLRIWDDLPSHVPAEAPQGNVVPLRRESSGWKPFRNSAKPSAYQNGF